MADASFSELLGKTIRNIEINAGRDEILFEIDTGDRFKLFHSQNCCENVSVEDCNGDLSDLIGSPITLAEEVTSQEWPQDKPKPDYTYSFTWTFYKLATSRGSVTIRWCGSSNGYYSETVEFVRQVQ